MTDKELLSAVDERIMWFSGLSDPDSNPMLPNTIIYCVRSKYDINTHPERIEAAIQSLLLIGAIGAAPYNDKIGYVPRTMEKD